MRLSSQETHEDGLKKEPIEDVVCEREFVTGIGFRLKEIREHFKVNQDVFAVSVGVERPTMSRWEREVAYPPANILHHLSELYRINIYWLITGNGLMLLDITETPTSCLSPEDFVIVPLAEGWVKGGPEGEILYGGIADYYPFKRWWIEKMVGRNHERHQDLLIVRVRGDSMSPTINPGELALVDTNEAERIEIRTGEIYVVTQPDGSVVIKRLALNEKEGQPRLICISDNISDYKLFEFPLERGRQLKQYVLGRVRWVGKEFD